MAAIIIAAVQYYHTTAFTMMESAASTISRARRILNGVPLALGKPAKTIVNGVGHSGAPINGVICPINDLINGLHCFSVLPGTRGETTEMMVTLGCHFVEVVFFLKFLKGFEVPMVMVIVKKQPLLRPIYFDASEYHWRSNSGCTL